MADSSTVIIPRWEWRTFGDDFGAAAKAIEALEPSGSAESDEPIADGEAVQVVAVDGMRVSVRRHRRR